MSLQQELAELAREITKQLPDEARDSIGNLLTGLRKSGITQKGPRVGERIDDFSLRNIYEGTSVGDRIKDFSLPNPWGNLISLSSLLQYGPVVLNFYRGNWCPFCAMELRALQQAVPEFKRRGAQLTAISLEKPDQSLQTVERNALSFVVLSDVGGRVARRFKLMYEAPGFNRTVLKDGLGVDLAEHNGENGGRLVVPATYVVDTDFTIRYAFVDEDFTRRADIEEILKTLTVLQAEKTTTMVG